MTKRKPKFDPENAPAGRIAVRDGSLVDACTKCALLNTALCEDTQCTGFTRPDGTDAHFIKVHENGEPSPEISPIIAGIKVEHTAVVTSKIVLYEDELEEIVKAAMPNMPDMQFRWLGTQGSAVLEITFSTTRYTNEELKDLI